MKGANGGSDIEGNAATGSGERLGREASFNGANGMSDIEGNAATGSGERPGEKRVSIRTHRSLLKWLNFER